TTTRNTSAPLPSPAIGATGGPVILDPAQILNFTQIAAAAGSGTNVYLAAGQTLSAIVHVLESTERFRVINRPVVFTSNNKKAIIASGQEVPVPISTLSSLVNANNTVTGTNVGQQSNIEFKRVALQLEVVPLINSEREVSLDILQKLDRLAGTTVVNGNAITNIAS